MDRLDPVRRWPRPRALLRHIVTAALLALAAVVLLTEPGGAAECRPDPSARSSPRAESTRPSGAEPSALPVPAGRVGVPIQLAEPATAAVARPGDRVDVIARTAQPSADTEVVVLAADALVLAVNAYGDSSPDEGIVYLAMTKDQAERVAKIAPDVALGITVRPR